MGVVRVVRVVAAAVVVSVVVVAAAMVVSVVVVSVVSGGITWQGVQGRCGAQSACNHHATTM